MNSRSGVSIFLTVLVLLFSPGTRADSCRDVFDQALLDNPPVDVSYDWTTAIFLFGAEKYARKHSLESKLEPYYEVLSKKIPEIRDPDTAALSLPASFGNSPSRELIVNASRKYFKEEKRNSLGVFDHTGTKGILGTLYPSSIWADSLIMATLNLIHLGEKERALKDGAIMMTHLKDGHSGLYVHAYYPKEGWTFPHEFHWARGNLWVALYLKETQNRVKLEKFLETLKTFYVPGKGLRTLLDDEKSDFESSATALYGYVLEPSEEVKQTILSFVKEKRFTGVSGPTTAFPLAAYYRSLIPSGTYLHGTGAFLLWCSVND